jgi:GTPase SAR1 family protein
MKDTVRTLWGDPGIQEVWSRRSEFQIIDSHTKYFDRLEEVASEGYVPTVDDILLCRTRTTGINTIQLEIKDVNEAINTFFIYDVGGQRNERRKWIHCFEDVTAVIFIAALSEFDQVLMEDSRQNRMVEAIEIFHQQLTSQWFASSAMILFLNKEDLFEEKLKTKDINEVDEWEDFEGSSWSTCDQTAPGALAQCKEDGVTYFLEKFQRLPLKFRTEGEAPKEIFAHVTTAINTDNARKVLEACQETILMKALQDTGFYS